MSATVGQAVPSPRALGRALGVVLRLPPPALAMLAGLLIDCLDGVGGDPDLEAEEDACDAEEVPFDLPSLYTHLPADLPGL